MALTPLVFESSYLNSVAGGKSALDSRRLHIFSTTEAQAFMRGYGFDPGLESDLEKLWDYYRRAFVLLTEKLGYSIQDIPDIFHDRKDLKQIENLLLMASKTDSSPEQKWACALLRAMHVFIHSENDLFSSYALEIQKQILSPFESRIIVDGTHHRTVLRANDSHFADVELELFQVKPFKTSTSTVLKLLAKPDALAMRVYDKLGVRFVTKNVFDSFQVIRLLVKENLISFPHIMPDQSSNNIYPVSLFIEICGDLLKEGKNLSSEQISQRLLSSLKDHPEHESLFKKENSFSGLDYKFIKFITRKLVRVPKNEREFFTFFFPYEVQIMDREAYAKVLSGPSEHVAYKERQVEAARKRLFPE
jgi:uncharacterized protein (TIGR04552 family)